MSGASISISGAAALQTSIVSGIGLPTCPLARWSPLGNPGAQAFTAWTAQGNAIRGWCALPQQPPRATVLIVHGITRNCTLDGIPRWGRLLLRAQCAVVAIDLRGHGHSDDGITTFGVGEASDLRAALDTCISQGMPGPYVVIGGSLGALAAQRAAVDDPRIAGAVLVSMPAWPWKKKTWPARSAYTTR